MKQNKKLKGTTIAGFVAILLLYVGVSIIVINMSRSEDVLVILGQPTPVRTLTGVFSIISNLSLILLVVFYGKVGFIVSLIILIAQFPPLFIAIFGQRNFSGMAGISTNLFSIITIIIIYMFYNRTRRYQGRLQEQATTDRVTGLPNRFACTELMDKLVRHKEPFSIAVLNLNNFKKINNTMGHHTGNAVLAETASRLTKAAQARGTTTEDFVSCQGGDEYAIIIQGTKSEEEIRDILHYYKVQLEDRLTVDGVDYYLPISIGYAMFPDDGTDSDALLSSANTAMTFSKKRKSETIRRFLPDLMDSSRSLEIERKLGEALEKGTLYYHLQPQYDISHKLIGFEALARMKDAEGNTVSPADFIPAAERAGLIDQVDRTVFRNSAIFFGQLIEKTHTDITLSVNVSVRHLMKNDFLDEVREILRVSKVPVEQLEIEITESIMIDSVDKALSVISDIKNMGIKVAIDDFGTGYSSLSYLNSFPADLLKVDKSFIDKMNTSDSSRQYVAAIISMGHVMNFKVISEGVEEPEQIETLRSIGCDYIQGFIWGRPMPPEEAEKLVA